ncbi:MAG: hypothetical protein ACM3SQ_01340 [Betaproteobacteria bacterium]
MTIRDVWWRPEGFNRFGFDPTKPLGPQVAWAVAQVAVILGGPILAVEAIGRYPFLVRDRTIYAGGLASAAVFFVVSFAVFRKKSLPKNIPLLSALMFRAGWSLAMTGWMLGLGLVINGYGTPLVGREAAVVGKRHTLDRDPSHRTYYLVVRAWQPSRLVVEVDAPRELYDELDVPVVPVDAPAAVLERMPDAAVVRLLVGKGRLGLEWLERVEAR